MSDMAADMDGHELNKCLGLLALSQTEVAVRLGVTTRTVRRWQAGEQKIPRWVIELLGAWNQLQLRNLPWGADLETFWFGDENQIRSHHDHDEALMQIVQRVAARRGPAVPWRVNLRDHSATLGSISVRFYRLASNSFSLASYSRSDLQPDINRDKTLIEDAVAAFAAAVSQALHTKPNQAWDE